MTQDLIIFSFGDSKDPYMEGDFVYFLSNQDLTKPYQTVEIQTRFGVGTTVTDVVNMKKYKVGTNGMVKFDISRDSTILLVSGE